MALKILGYIEIGRPDNECKLKIGTGVGSQHLFLKNEYGDFFDDIDDFFFCKQDLISYLKDAKEEFFHPSEDYHFVRVARQEDRRQGITSPTVSIPVNLEQYWNTLMQEVKDLEDISFLGFVKGMDNDDAGRFYYHNDSLNSAYSILYRMCIPTKQARTIKKYRSIYRLVKIQDTLLNKKYIHIIPIFNMNYSIEQLSDFLKRDYPEEAEKQKSFIFDFFFKYADLIKSNEYSLTEIVNQAGIDINYINELQIALDSFSKNFADIKNIYHLHANSDRIYCDENNSNKTLNANLQQIYFGTPGSGKSFIIKREYEMTKVGGEWIEDEEKKKRVIRTTFHPDTDYASFVGCYKPISYDVGNEKKIKYEFVPQAFTEAYVKAWNDLDSQYYLVLEEINRGNCAQIFGDLFQLLDRKSDGSSEYPIKADSDLRKYLEKAKDDNNNDILLNKEGIRDGKLCLPPNLNIIASMNTSDQSLFPMDSAFKRRWSWEYVPIDYNNIKSGLFTITIGSMTYLWHEFLKKINQKIKKVTSSEDKQMGNFFIKQSVDEKEFKDKVMFYLWSEVGKDNYQTKDAIFHCYKPGTTDEQEFSYNELYPFGTSKLQQFMSILGVEPLSTEDLNEIEEESNESSGQKNFDKFSINGSGEYNKRTVAYEAVQLYVINHPNETAQTIVDTWMALDFKVPNFIETSLTHEQRQLTSKDKLFDERSRQLELPNGEVVYISKNYTLERIQDFIEKVNAQDWNIHIEKI